MSLKQLLADVSAGDHSACASCPSSPRHFPGAAFGVSCREHGVDWQTSGTAVSMMIVRDPAGTTPATTGWLCFVCNSSNPTDRTAQHAFSLWRAAVALSDDAEKACRYLGDHYWTNAALHGSDTSRLERARRCCARVLRDQIEALSPRVVIASGVQAATSLHELGLLNARWCDIRTGFDKGAHLERVRRPSGATEVYCTYHTSATGVNCEVSKLYSNSTDKLLAQRRAALSDADAFDRFLGQYRPESAEGRGMRVLLLHWLDIGEGIRRAHAANRTSASP